MERLRLLRNQKGFSQQQLANELSISKSAVGMYEQGRREPSHEMLKRIALFFDVSVDYLLERAHSKKLQLPHPTQLADELVDQLMDHNALMFHSNQLSAQDYRKISQAVRQAVDIVLERQDNPKKEPHQST